MLGEAIVALIALTLMEIVLGIDNIVFITIVSSRLPASQRPAARRLGLTLALAFRILLLCTLKFALENLQEPFFHLSALGITQSLTRIDDEHAWKSINEISWRDVILFLGGIFLLAKSVHEIHKQMETDHAFHGSTKAASFIVVLVQIGILDIVFSLDSVITAVGMAEDLWVMITAVVLAMVTMIIFANPIGNFVEAHPTLRMLALSFLILIGVMLVAEGIGTHFNKNYIYFAMAFALIVEMLNLRVRSNHEKKAGRGGADAH
jgi:predicted tellurium resistance membrane protein TerC